MVRARASMIEFEVKKESAYTGRYPTLLYRNYFNCPLGTMDRHA